MIHISGDHHVCTHRTSVGQHTYNHETILKTIPHHLRATVNVSGKANGHESVLLGTQVGNGLMSILHMAPLSFRLQVVLGDYYLSNGAQKRDPYTYLHMYVCMESYHYPRKPQLHPPSQNIGPGSCDAEPLGGVMFGDMRVSEHQPKLTYSLSSLKVPPLLPMWLPT